MGLLIYSIVFGLGGWVFWRYMSKEPILPWSNKKSQSKKDVSKSGAPPSKNHKRSKKKNSPDDYEEVEPNLFQHFLEDMEGITDHMIRLVNNEFVLIAEAIPVNYHLLSQHEQESIDNEVERWLSKLDYPTKPYFQNRYIDLTEPIEEIKNNLNSQDDIPEAAYRYGISMMEDLAEFQARTPRYETKRYIIFNYQVPVSEIEADSDEELEERILDKAFQELYRRYNTAKSSLGKGKIGLELLTSDGIVGLLYYTFNRKKAVKHRFKDIVEREKLALYPTAVQEQRKIELVKEMIENGSHEEDEETAS
ncbi:hypothetical protein [Pontibacillus halophilus]|uniref:hypothetical protein n=1 Tax=Pontibacillus halophilus TaxID=516704 RepID=UPI00042210A1|nr:hypothetical protein [Pontibacillus halophilus]